MSLQYVLEVFFIIKWIFLDIGSTIVDESYCEDIRIQETLIQLNSPSKEAFIERMKYNAMLNKDAYKTTLTDYNLNKCKWRLEYEKLYPKVKDVLEILHTKYKLGIIANQSIGLKKRLSNYGITKYFALIISSAEAEISKPSLEIFELALNEAFCTPSEAIMVGDRIDNDIILAQLIGMKTVWIRQGYGGFGSIKVLEKKPDFIVERFEELLEIDFNH